MALPSNVKYDMKPSSVPIQRKTLVIPTLNKRDYTMSTTSGETLTFYLPSLNNTVMDGTTGFLRFNVSITNTSGANRTFNLDQGAWCLFESLEVRGASGQQIEIISGYNVLMNALVDCQVDMSSKSGLSTAWGVEEHNTRYQIFTADSANTTAVALNGSLGFVDTNRTGYSFGVIANGATATASFSIPILSGLFALSEKCWPSFAMMDDTRVDLQLGTLSQCLFCSGAPGASVLTVSNPEIVVDYLYMTPESMAQVQSVYAGRDLIVHATSYRNYQHTISAGVTGNIQSILPCKLVSTKMLLQTFRPSPHTTAFNAYSLSSRVNPLSSATDRWSLNIGGETVPSHGISTNITSFYDMFFLELQRAFHSLNVMSIDGSIPRSYYNVNAQAFGALPAGADTIASYRNGFLLGVNLDSVIRSSELILSGRDMSKVSTYHEYRISTAPAYQITSNTYIYHDILFIIGSDGSVSSRF